MPRHPSQPVAIHFPARINDNENLTLMMATGWITNSPP